VRTISADRVRIEDRDLELIEDSDYDWIEDVEVVCAVFVVLRQLALWWG
jgi:hypothetical protein